MNSTIFCQPASQAAGAPVSWQTIFWTLVPLATSSMTQPGGRICGLPSRYRTYLRCSPILCAADAFSVVSQLALLCLHQKQRFLEALGIILHERFNADEDSDSQQGAATLLQDDDEIESVQRLESMTWLRWLWFTLGTLPPAIKLMSMSAVPWEQAWGMMFLTSWIINESLIICAALNHTFFTVSRSGRISWSGFEQMILSSRYRNFRARVAALQYSLGASALVVHVVILNGVFRSIFRQRRFYLSTLRFNSAFHTYPLNPYRPAVSVAPVLMISICMQGFVAVCYFTLRRLGVPRNGVVLFPFFNTFLVIVSVAINLFFPSIWGVYNASNSAPYVFGYTSLGFVAFLALVSSLASWSVILGKNLLVLFTSRDENNPRIDDGGVLSLGFFLSTLLGAILWYGYVYDSAGTVNPSWTGIFG